MDWDKKVKMIELAQDSADTTEFQQFIKDHVDSFDAQAWSMLINVLELTEQNIKSNLALAQIVFEKYEFASQEPKQIGLSLKDVLRFNTLGILISASR